MWNEKLELPDGSYSVSDIQDQCDYIMKSDTFTDNPPIIKYINKIENRITFKTKKSYYLSYYLELLMPETMKLFGSTKRN